MKVDGNAVHLLSRPCVRKSFGGEFGHSRMNVLYPEGDADSTAGPSVELLYCSGFQSKRRTRQWKKEIKSSQGKKGSFGTGFSSLVLLLLQTNKNSHKKQAIKKPNPQIPMYLISPAHIYTRQTVCCTTHHGLQVHYCPGVRGQHRSKPWTVQLNPLHM
jgi:hypothetical protein